MTSRTPPPTLFKLDDARLLARLVGPHGANLTVLEAAFNVDLEAPGGGVRVSNGGADDRARVLEALKLLAREAASGDGPSAEDTRAIAQRVLDGEGAVEGGFIRVGRKSFGGRTAAQRAYVEALTDEANALIFGVGPAGTGKTFLAVVYGAALLASGGIKRLVVARPAVEAGEKLGFLPGDLGEKVDPYMLPIWDALQECLGSATVEKRRQDRSIEVAPLAFMRGRTLRDAFVIVDEAQNATISQMQMVLTRIGEGTRMAVTGDPSQIDLRIGEPSGLPHALSILSDIEGVKAVHLTKADVQRHALVGRIIHAYEQDGHVRDRMKRP